MSSIPYRHDIDGLRAIAVVAVIIFHLGLGVLPGGFLGVDIFFVISGYLIGGIVIREQEAGTFSFRDFYMRRLRRIMPAMLVVIVCSVVAGYFMAYPTALFSIGRHAFNASVFFHNFFQILDNGAYFDVLSRQKPLLHMWSLSVEEQFYLVFPLIALALGRARRLHAPAILAVAGLSFVVAQVMLVTDRGGFAYYASFTRAWELFAGVAAGQIVGGRIRLPGQVLRAGHVVAIAVILTSILVVNETMAIPGWVCLPTIVATAFLLATGGTVDSMVTRMLGWPPMRAVGRISYSLYLWHWPVIVFGDIYFEDRGSASIVTTKLLVMTGLALASYFLVENPVRSRRVLASSPALLATIAVAIAGIGLFSRGADATRGYPDRVARFPAGFVPAPGVTCGTDALTINKSVCRIGPENNAEARARFVYVGDSHAEMFAPAVSRIAGQLGGIGYVVAEGGCPPVITSANGSPDPRLNPKCRRVTEAIAPLAEALDPKVPFILGARWISKIGADKTVSGDFLTTLEATIVTLREKGHPVILAGPIPGPHVNVGKLFFERKLLGRATESMTMPLADHQAASAEMRAFVRRMQERYQIGHIDPEQLLCDSSVCHLVMNGTALYSDDSHLNRYGTALFEPMIRKILEEVAAR